jgi:hypothetical protein
MKRLLALMSLVVLIPAMSMAGDNGMINKKVSSVLK